MTLTCLEPPRPLGIVNNCQMISNPLSPLLLTLLMDDPLNGNKFVERTNFGRVDIKHTYVAYIITHYQCVDRTQNHTSYVKLIFLLKCRSVYKLTDFGAARELQHGDDEFMSLCGTEEYLVLIL